MSLFCGLFLGLHIFGKKVPFCLLRSLWFCWCLHLEVSLLPLSLFAFLQLQMKIQQYSIVVQYCLFNYISLHCLPVQVGGQMTVCFSFLILNLCMASSLFSFSSMQCNGSGTLAYSSSFTSFSSSFNRVLP